MFTRFWFLRELRRKKLWFLGSLISLGIAGLSFVDLFSQRISATATQDTRKFLSADFVIQSWQKFDEDFFEKMQTLVPEESQTWQRRMLASFSDENGDISSINLLATEGRYPFYGDWKTKEGLLISDLQANEVFLEVAAENKGFQKGQILTIGGSEFTVRDFVEEEPEALNFFRAGDYRVWMNFAGFDRSGLDKEGSRIFNRLFLEASGKDPKEFRQTFRETIEDPTIRFRSAEQSNAQAQRSVQVLRAFLSLIALCGTLLGLVGLFFLFISDLEQRVGTFLSLRCLGVQRKELIQSIVLPLGFSALFGASIGYLLGVAIEAQVAVYASESLGVAFAAPYSYLTTYLVGLLTTFLALLPTLYFPLKKLLSLPTQSLFSGMSTSNTLISSFSGRAVASCLVITFVLSLISSRSLQQSAIGFFSVLGVLLLLWGMMELLIRVVRKSIENKKKLSFLKTYFFQTLVRKRSQNFVWTLSLSLSLFLLSLGLVLANSVQSQVQAAQDGATPNLLTLGLTQSDKDMTQEAFPEETEWVPYFMSRLYSIEGTSIQEIREDAEELVDETGENERRVREYFVNTRLENELFEGEKIIEGESLFARPEGTVADAIRVSLEEGFAERMQLNRVGIQFVMDVAGIELPAVVSSIRKVQWFQFRPNFFIIVNRKDIEGAPVSFTALSRVDSEAIAATQKNIVSQLPHVTPLNLEQSAEKVKDLLGRIRLSVESSSLFLFVAALLVLISISWAKRNEKKEEFALLKCLGVTPSQLKQLLIAEAFIASLFAGIATWIFVLPMGQGISYFFFNSDLSLPSLGLAIGYTAGALAIVTLLYYALNRDLADRGSNELFQDSAG